MPRTTVDSSALLRAAPLLAALGLLVPALPARASAPVYGYDVIAVYPHDTGASGRCGEQPVDGCRIDRALWRILNTLRN